MIDYCLFQFHRTVACWAFAEGGRREEESRGLAWAEKQQREGVRQGGDRQRETLQQRILPRTGQEASKTGPRELEGWNTKILSRGVCAQALKRQTNLSQCGGEFCWCDCVNKASETYFIADRKGQRSGSATVLPLQGFTHHHFNQTDGCLTGGSVKTLKHGANNCYSPFLLPQNKGK